MNDEFGMSLAWNMNEWLVIYVIMELVWAILVYWLLEHVGFVRA